MALNQKCDDACFQYLDVSERSMKGIEEILSALLHGIGDAALQAASEIRMLTANSAKSRVSLAAVGVIDPLVSMLGVNDLEANQASMRALMNLAVRNERNKIAIVKSGAIRHLVQLLQLGTQETKELAAAMVLTLSLADANKTAIGHSGAVPLLVEIISSGAIQGKVDAVMALYCLSTNVQNLSVIFKAGAIRPLLMLLKDCKKASRVAEKMVAILEALIVFREARESIGDGDGGILALVEVLEDGSMQAREYAVSILLRICESSRSKYRQAILEEGAIPGLLELTVQGSRAAQRKAQKLLQLLRNPSAPQRAVSASSVLLESMVYDIAAHVDNGEPDFDTAKEMLAEILQMNSEQSMDCLKQRSMIALSNAS